MKRRIEDEGLFAKLVVLMEEKELYLRKGLSRDDLAREAATNRTYLSRTLNARGMNFSQFVNSFRVQRAIEIFWQPEHADTPFADIAEMCGFTCEDALNRHLKKNAGCTACALRKRVSGSD